MVGHPPMHYLTLWRMQLASRLLQEGQQVVAVAAAMGYESESAFSRVFKKLMGVPPANWRRRPNRPGGFDLRFDLFHRHRRDSGPQWSGQGCTERRRCHGDKHEKVEQTTRSLRDDVPRGADMGIAGSGPERPVQGLHHRAVASWIPGVDQGLGYMGDYYARVTIIGVEHSNGGACDDSTSTGILVPFQLFKNFSKTSDCSARTPWVFTQQVPAGQTCT